MMGGDRFIRIKPYGKVKSDIFLSFFNRMSYHFLH